MFKKLVVRSNFVWINDLFNIEQIYNDTWHSSIYNTPNNVFYKNIKLESQNNNDFDKLAIG